MRRFLLLCGIAASLLYVVADAVAALLWDEYSYASHAVSELMGLGSPVRPLLVALFSVYDALTVAFGIGVWAVAGRRRSLRAAGVLLALSGVIGFVGLVFAPLHPRGTERTLTDTLHIVVTAVLVLDFLIAMSLAAAARGRGFRLYTAATILVMVAFGALSSLYAPRLDAGLPTPWLGILERVNIFAYMLWALVLGAVLLREEPRPRGRTAA